MTPRIRDYTDADYEDVKQNLEDGGRFDVELDGRDIFQRKITLRPGSILVAEDDGHVVGNVLLIYDGWMPLVFRLAVRRAYRNQGLGTRLLEAAEHRLKEWGATGVSLLFDDREQHLRAFYAKRGYVDWREPAHGMYKPL